MSRKIAVPGFSHEMKIPLLVSGYVLISVLVALTFHHPLRAPVTLPWTALDEAIPFMRWATFIYFLHFPFVFFVLYSLKDRLNMNRVGASMVLSAIIGLAILALFPTVLPAGKIFHFPGFKLFYTVGNPSGCIPSLHVCFAYLAALAYRDEQKELFFPALIGATIIASSTLLTKQHYFVDWPAGMFLAWTSRWLIDRHFEFCFRQLDQHGLEIHL